MLTQRALNRALLARQMLLDRHAMPAADAIERLGGMQAQAPFPPYYGLWTRLDGFAPDQLARLLIERRVVRVTLMRRTIHLVTARDCLAWRSLFQPLLARWFQVASPWARALDGVDLAAVLAAGRELLTERPRTIAEVGAALAERWPERDPAALGGAVHYLLPMTQVPPRAVWGKSGKPAWAPVEDWLGAPVGSDPAPDDLVRRYLAAFGPATAADAQQWSGLTRLGEVFARLRPELATFRDERGRELFDLPDAPRPDPETPAPVRFLPEFDNLLLSHADRTRILTDEHRSLVFTNNGIIKATILVDGYARGLWSIARGKGTATLTVEPFAPLSAANLLALEDEGNRLLGFAVGSEATRVVRVAAPV